MAFTEIFPIRPPKDATLRPTKNGSTLYLHPYGVEILANYGKTLTVGDRCQMFFDPETKQFALRKNKDGQFTWRNNGTGTGLRLCLNQLKEIPKTITYKVVCPQTLEEKRAERWKTFDFLLQPVLEK